MNRITKSKVIGPEHPPLLEKTIGSHLKDIATLHGDCPALVVCHQDVRWTYATYLKQIDRLAAGFLALGVRPGDRVGVWSPNCFEWCLTQFATARIGAVLVCINPAYRVFELEYALNQSECRAIVLAECFKSSNYLEMLEELAPELKSSEPGKLNSRRLPKPETVIRIGDSPAPGILNFTEVWDMGRERERNELRLIEGSLDPHDPINIQFTSGTTGSPKGATLTHHNILNNAYFAGREMGMKPGERLCIPVPLYHCFGMVLGNLVCVAHGAAAVFPGPVFDAGDTLQAVALEQCTGLHGVPTMFLAELRHESFESYETSSLRTGIMAGAPCPVSLMNEVIERMHMLEVLIGYGQTELSPLNCLTHADDPIEKRVGTVGTVGPHLELKIVDSDDRCVPVGMQGEICTRGYSVMQGYWQEPLRTAEAIDEDGWLHSGDLGELDAEGYVKVTGRLKDMIIRGGENIYPKEIEEFLYSHPAVQEVAVFGVPDEKFGEQVCAWIQLRAGHSANEKSIRAFCEDGISHFKIPHYISLVHAFPMTVTGKMKKFEMRNAMIRELGLR